MKNISIQNQLYIAGQIVKQKVKSSVSQIKELPGFYELDMNTIDREIERLSCNNINELMMYEGCTGLLVFSKIFNQLASGFNFKGCNNRSYLWPVLICFAVLDTHILRMLYSVFILLLIFLQFS